MIFSNSFNVANFTRIRWSILTGCLLMSTVLMAQSPTRTISKAALLDKIKGGWAGKMIGVTYGAPIEFRAQYATYDDSINWTPKDIRGSMWQDDIYVQLTFMMTMDQFGMDAPAKPDICFGMQMSKLGKIITTAFSLLPLEALNLVIILMILIFKLKQII